MRAQNQKPVSTTKAATLKHEKGAQAAIAADTQSTPVFRIVEYKAVETKPKKLKPATPLVPTATDPVEIFEITRGNSISVAPSVKVVNKDSKNWVSYSDAEESLTKHNDYQSYSDAEEFLEPTLRQQLGEDTYKEFHQWISDLEDKCAPILMPGQPFEDLRPLAEKAKDKASVLLREFEEATPVTRSALKLGKLVVAITLLESDTKELESWFQQQYQERKEGDERAKLAIRKAMTKLNPKPQPYRTPDHSIEVGSDRNDPSPVPSPFQISAPSPLIEVVVSHEKKFGRDHQIPASTRNAISPLSSVDKPVNASIAKAGHKPSHRPVGNLVHNATHRPVGRPANKVVVKPVVKRVGKPAKKAVVKPVVKSVDNFLVKEIKKPTGKPINKPFNRPASESVPKPVDIPVDKPVDISIIESVDRLINKIAVKAVKKPAGRPIRKPASEQVPEAAGKPVDKAVRTPIDKPGSKPLAGSGRGDQQPPASPVLESDAAPVTSPAVSERSFTEYREVKLNDDLNDESEPKTKTTGFHVESTSESAIEHARAQTESELVSLSSSSQVDGELDDLAAGFDKISIKPESDLPAWLSASITPISMKTSSGLTGKYRSVKKALRIQKAAKAVVAAKELRRLKSFVLVLSSITRCSGTVLESVAKTDDAAKAEEVVPQLVTRDEQKPADDNNKSCNVSSPTLSSVPYSFEQDEFDEPLSESKVPGLSTTENVANPGKQEPPASNEIVIDEVPAAATATNMQPAEEAHSQHEIGLQPLDSRRVGPETDEMESEPTLVQPAVQAYDHQSAAGHSVISVPMTLMVGMVPTTISDSEAVAAPDDMEYDPTEPSTVLGDGNERRTDDSDMADVIKEPTETAPLDAHMADDHGSVQYDIALTKALQRDMDTDEPEKLSRLATILKSLDVLKPQVEPEDVAMNGDKDDQPAVDIAGSAQDDELTDAPRQQTEPNVSGNIDVETDPIPQTADHTMSGQPTSRATVEQSGLTSQTLPVTRSQGFKAGSFLAGSFFNLPVSGSPTIGSVSNPATQPLPAPIGNTLPPFGGSCLPQAQSTAGVFDSRSIPTVSNPFSGPAVSSSSTGAVPDVVSAFASFFDKDAAIATSSNTSAGSKGCIDPSLSNTHFLGQGTASSSSIGQNPTAQPAHNDTPAVKTSESEVPRSQIIVSYEDNTWPGVSDEDDTLQPEKAEEKVDRPLPTAEEIARQIPTAGKSIPDLMQHFQILSCSDKIRAAFIALVVDVSSQKPDSQLMVLKPGYSGYVNPSPAFKLILTPPKPPTSNAPPGFTSHLPWPEDASEPSKYLAPSKVPGSTRSTAVKPKTAANATPAGKTFGPKEQGGDDVWEVAPGGTRRLKKAGREKSSIICEDELISVEGLENFMKTTYKNGTSIAALAIDFEVPNTLWEEFLRRVKQVAVWDETQRLFLPQHAAQPNPFPTEREIHAALPASMKFLADCFRARFGEDEDKSKEMEFRSAVERIGRYNPKDRKFHARSEDPPAQPQGADDLSMTAGKRKTAVVEADQVKAKQIEAEQATSNQETPEEVDELMSLISGEQSAAIDTPVKFPTRGEIRAEISFAGTASEYLDQRFSTSRMSEEQRKEFFRLVDEVAKRTMDPDAPVFFFKKPETIIVEEGKVYQVKYVNTMVGRVQH